MTRSLVKCVAVVALVVGMISLFMPSQAFANEQDWQYVQSIGGMKLGTPVVKNGDWTMPVDIDVTGTRSISTKPTTMHSGVVCEGVQAEIHDQNIYLSLFTGYPWVGSGAGGGTCPLIELGHLSPGKYTVYYRGLNEDPVKLTEITLAP